MKEEAAKKEQESTAKKKKKKPSTKVDSEKVKEKQVVGEEMKKMQEMMKSWSQSKVLKEKYRGTDASLTDEEEASEAVDSAPPYLLKRQ